MTTIREIMTRQLFSCLPDDSAEDALEYLMAGAHCVQVGTACFAEPGAIVRISEELRALMDELGIPTVADAVGCLEALPPEAPLRSRSSA